MRKKSNIIWTIEANDLQRVINESISYLQVLQKIGANTNSGTYKTLQARIRQDNLNVTSIQTSKKYANKGRNVPITPLEDILVENSTYTHTSHLKARLLREGLLENKCYECNCLPIWNNKTLVLILDHVNGVNNDNRIENLRLLCPNCNSQTPTFAGRNIAYKREDNHCQYCNKKVSRVSNICKSCSARVNNYIPKKVEWPSKEELLELIRTTPFTKIGEMYGVSDNAVRKWCKYYGLPFRRKEIEEYFNQLTT